MPSADEHLTTGRVRTLLCEQFPYLADRPLTLLANGWDNTLIRLGEDLLIRMPRRQASAQLVAKEQTWLPRLAPRLPLTVPTPIFLGRPSPSYPWTWSITKYIDGTDAANAPRLDTGDSARVLGTFLGSLHRRAPSDAPRNPVRGVDLRLRDERFRQNLALIGHLIDTAAALAVWRAALEAEPWANPPVWLHGDLHPANLLVRNARIVAVIDFGDLTGGDPATDLAIAWMLLPEGDRLAFWRAYAARASHLVSPNLVVRSRGWSLALAAAFLARSADNPTMQRIGTCTAAAALQPDVTSAGP